MSNREEYIFWKLANTLILDHGYRIIQLFENQKELWLEKLENRKAPIIRMLLHNLDWSNAMQRDIEFTAANGENIRKQLRRYEIHIVNIYISEFPPVDEYEYRLAKPFMNPDGKKTTVTSFLLAKDLYNEEIGRLAVLLQKDIPFFPIHEEYTEQVVESLKIQTLEQARNLAKAERAVLSYSRPLMTYVLILVNIAVFLWEQVNGGSTNTATLVKLGAKVNELIYEGEWWRFITPMFLHIGLIHLALNSLALYYLGIAVEQIFGRLRFSVIYLFAGIAGVIASFLFNSGLSAGASGAIYGCFGALLYFGTSYPKLFFRTMGINLFVVLGINLLFSFTGPGIDSAGHIGGLLGGFLAAGIVHFPKKRKLLLQFIFLIVSFGLVFGSLAYGFSSSVKGQDEMYNLIQAQNYIKQNQYDKAYRLLKSYEQNAEHVSDKTYFLLSYVDIKKNNLPDAKKHLQKAIQLNPDFDEAYYNLALINLEQNDLTQAKQNAEKALKLKPDQKNYAQLVNEINQQLKSPGGEQ